MRERSSSGLTPADCNRGPRRRRGPASALMPITRVCAAMSFLRSAQGWPYLLTPFIPLAIVLDVAHASAGLVFFVAALGIIPTAALMGLATEELAARSGPGSAAC